MDSVLQHIKDHYPAGSVLSKVFYQESTIDAGKNVVEFNYAAVGAIAILTLYIYYLIATVEVGEGVFAPSFQTITFTDQFNQVLFRTNSIGSGWAPIPQITEGPRLRIISSPPNRSLKFQIAHQYLLQPSKV